MLQIDAAYKSSRNPDFLFETNWLLKNWVKSDPP